MIYIQGQEIGTPSYKWTEIDYLKTKGQTSCERTALSVEFSAQQYEPSLMQRPSELCKWDNIKIKILSDARDYRICGEVILL